MSDDPSEFDGRSVTVMGLGRFSGGREVARYLHAHGALVTISDEGTAEELEDSLGRIADLDHVRLHLGGHRESDFLDADIIVVNPAVRPRHPFVARARGRGICITSEIALFWQRCRGRIAGVTGTNGKSTTAALLHHLLQAEGRRCWVGGNIGRSLLPAVDRIRTDDWVVLELSSFQLAALDELQVSPDIAVVTNFAPNHLDWHGSVDAYRHAKQTILRWQEADNVAVVNAADETCRWEVNGRRHSFSIEDCIAPSIANTNPALRGRHQWENVAAASVAAAVIGASPAAIASGLQSFAGLPQRLQCLGTKLDRHWINDSAATTPESTIAALESFEAPVVLLVGGADKGADFTALAEQIVKSSRAVVLMGDVAEKLEGLIRDRQAAMTGQRGKRLASVRSAESLSAAVSQAIELSHPGDVLLFSPACASYGWFSNYSERGTAFANLVRRLRV